MMHQNLAQDVETRALRMAPEFAIPDVQAMTFDHEFRIALMALWPADNIRKATLRPIKTDVSDDLIRSMLQELADWKAQWQPQPQ
jgi:hypothetical protein